MFSLSISTGPSRKEKLLKIAFFQSLGARDFTYIFQKFIDSPTIF